MASGHTQSINVCAAPQAKLVYFIVMPTPIASRATVLISSVPRICEQVIISYIE